jgi:hypothetical protein
VKNKYKGKNTAANLTFKETGIMDIFQTAKKKVFKLHHTGSDLCQMALE